MNVLLSSYVHWWNAEAAYAARLAEALLDAGHQVWILTQPGTRNAMELEKLKLPLVTDIPPPGGSPLGWLRSLVALRRFQSENEIDIVNVFRSREFLWHRFAARAAPYPKVIRTRGSAHPLRRGWFNRKLYGDWCDGLIASSRIVAHEIREKLGISQQQIELIYYPAEAPLERSEDQRVNGKSDLLKKLEIAQAEPLLGIVGRLYPEKGHMILLSALEALVKKHPHLLLVIFAKSASGEDPERPRLEEKIRLAGLENNVRFTGFLEDLPAVIPSLEVGVIPSIASEVNCRVAMEFFSAGVPVAAFPTGALPEVVEDGLTGRVARDHSAQALAEILERMISDSGLAGRLASKAREAALGKYSKRRFLEATLQVYQSALERKSGKG